jgi:hypothetical protein
MTFQWSTSISTIRAAVERKQGSSANTMIGVFTRWLNKFGRDKRARLADYNERVDRKAQRLIAIFGAEALQEAVWRGSYAKMVSDHEATHLWPDVAAKIQDILAKHDQS